MKYMILMNATAAGLASFGAMSKDEIKAHILFMKGLNEDLKASGELVEAIGLGGPQEAKLVRAREGLDADPRLQQHHRLDAVRAHLLEMAGDTNGALTHYRRAAERTTSVPEQRYLLARAARLTS